MDKVYSLIQIDMIHSLITDGHGLLLQMSMIYSLIVLPGKHGQHMGIMTPAASSSSSSALSHFWFPIDNSWKDASISFKLYRRVKHNFIQVKFQKGDNSQNFD